MTLPLRPDVSQLADSAVATQLRRGCRRLRFEPALEQDFRDDYLLSNRTQLRLNLSLAVLLVTAFAILDRTLLDDSTQRLPDLLRFGVILPLLFVLIAISYTGAYLRWYPRLVKFSVPAVGICVVVIEAQAARAGVQQVFATLVITTIYVYFLVGMRFYAAFAGNLFILIGYLAVAFALQPVLPAQQVVYNGSVLMLAHLVGAVACYNLETANRLRYLEARLLAEMAARDGLTGIYNRRMFDERLEQLWQQAVREQAPLAVLLVDIDFFKPFNDRYGHQAGDETLKAVAAILSRHARRPLDFTARYGGEEFAVVQYGVDCRAISEIAERIRAEVQALGIGHERSTAALVLTVSIGIGCVYPKSERSHQGLVQLADEALYAAKNLGRNRVMVKESEYDDLITGDFRADGTG